MNETQWTPRVGEVVKLIVAYPEFRGVVARGPINVRLATVAKVTQAGYVHVEGRSDKFVRTRNPTCYLEYCPRIHLPRQYLVTLQPATAEELEQLPNNDVDGRAYAGALRQKQKETA